jgi:hypothetical protein
VGHRALGTGASSTTIIGGSANRRNDHTQHSHDSYEYPTSRALAIGARSFSDLFSDGPSLS